MSDTPIYGLRDLIAPVLDEAIHQVAPKDSIIWEITYVMTMTQFGPQPQGLLILSMPAPILGMGSMIVTLTCDLRELTDHAKTFDHVRNLVELMRRQRADMLDPTKQN